MYSEGDILNSSPTEWLRPAFIDGMEIGTRYSHGFDAFSIPPRFCHYVKYTLGLQRSRKPIVDPFRCVVEEIFRHIGIRCRRVSAVVARSYAGGGTFHDDKVLVGAFSI
jgi:hypothetical protein